MRRAIMSAALLPVALLACGDDTASTAATPVIDPGDGGNYEVEIDPSRFSSRVDNPYAPKLPGMRWTYTATAADGEVNVTSIEVLDETRIVMGVEAIVVHDVETSADGELLEETYDWFAQDADGNVWYFGEETTAYENGAPSTKGSWEAGTDGALPGIVMPAKPTVSDTGFRQEYLAGEAEDMGQVLTVANGVVITRDWTPLEADSVEEKSYARGVGFVFESKTVAGVADATVVLTEFSHGQE